MTLYPGEEGKGITERYLTVRSLKQLTRVQFTEGMNGGGVTHFLRSLIQTTDWGGSRKKVY